MATNSTPDRLSVLVVDDDEDSRDFVAMCLEKEGMGTVQVPDGEKAVAALGASDFDVVVTDIRLPGMDGIALLRHVRDRFGDLPVVLITGHSSVESAVRALRLGAQDYFVKPLEDPTELLAVVRKAADQHRQAIRSRASTEAERRRSQRIGDGEVPALSLPDHDILACIGEGSYGEVWLARNVTGQLRAVKVIHRGRFESARPFDRELTGIRRYEPVSRSHVGLVDVLHVGKNEKEGYLYYVMELADDYRTGREIVPGTYVPYTLRRDISTRHQLPVAECVGIGMALSSALDYLHQNELVHRDVKPSNVILVDGVPKLSDIGLVSGIGATQSFVGTEGYVPPEGPGMPKADIYSLGKVLYEISTGRDRLQFPELPTRLEDDVEREHFLALNEIVLKACRNDARKRFKDAEELHGSLIELRGKVGE